MSEQARRVAITGGTGFLGAACVERLIARGDDVYVLSRSNRVPQGATWIACDLRDELSVRKIMQDLAPTSLLHLAWHVRTPNEGNAEYQASAAHDEWVDISSSLFRSFAATGRGTGIVAAGSAFEYGSPTTPKREDAAIEGSITRYALRKRETQVALAHVAGAHVPWSWCRIFPLYGGGESPSRLLSRVTRSLLAGEQVVCNHSRYTRDLVYCADAADALVALSHSSAPAGVVNIGTGVGHTLRDVLCRVSTLLGAEHLLSFDDDEKVAYNESEPAVLVADVERERQMLGFVPSTPLELGLARTIAYWRARSHDG